MRNIGKNIKRELDDALMTQKELSDDTGISESTITRYINGEIMPALVNINNISCALDCTPNLIIGYRYNFVHRY